VGVKWGFDLETRRIIYLAAQGQTYDSDNSFTFILLLRKIHTGPANARVARRRADFHHFPMKTKPAMVMRKLGDDRNETAKKARTTDKNFKQSRDVHEDRGCVQSKMGKSVHTDKGKARR
jgi:hypothetical protein